MGGKRSLKFVYRCSLTCASIFPRLFCSLFSVPLPYSSRLSPLSEHLEQLKPPKIPYMYFVVLDLIDNILIFENLTKQKIAGQPFMNMVYWNFQKFIEINIKFIKFIESLHSNSQVSLLVLWL